ncbi:MAG: hypothetical protein ACRDNA_05065 [Gaiellaceae bacterium]
MNRGALAGAVAAAVWAAAEPGIARLVRPPTGYSDIRLLGALLTGDGRRWRAAGLGAHLVNGALFGAAFSRAGARGWRQGLAAAQAENLALWPVMALLDRVHPDRRSGVWPPLAGHRRVFAYEVAVHALFGTVLGALLNGRSPRPERPR